MTEQTEQTASSIDSDTVNAELRHLAELQLNKAWKRFLDGFRVVGTLRDLASSSLAYTSQHVHTQARIALQWAISKNIIKSDPTTRTPEQFEVLADAMEQASLETYVGSIKAACLVFWHSVLDGVTLDLCKVTTIVAPATWDIEVGRKTVPLESVRSSNYADLRSQVLSKRLGELDRESVVKKIEILYKLCGIDEEWSGVIGYSFDLSRVRDIDGRRHEIVHGNGLTAASRINEDDIDYFSKTATHLCAMVAFRFGLKLDLAKVYGK